MKKITDNKSKKMNILIYYRCELYPNKGGIERISYDLMKEFKVRGHNVYFLIKERIFPEENFDMECEMVSLEGENFDNPKTKNIIDKIIKDKEIDVILNQDYGNITIVEHVILNYNVPIISAIHTAPNFDELILRNNYCYIYSLFTKFNIKKIIKFLCRPILVYNLKKKNIAHYSNLVKKSDKVVLLSERFKSAIYNYVGEDNNKITCIPNFTKFSNVNSLNKKENIVLYVSRLEYGSKRPDRILKIWEKVYKNNPDWKLKIVGDGAEKKYMDKYITKKKIQNVEMLGFKAAEKEFEEASIFCLTSTVEGLAVVLLESLNSKCVPMSFDSFESVHDIIENDENGVIIKSFDLNSYAKKLDKLMNDKKYYKKLQDNNELTLENFDKDLIVNKWLELFEQCINENKKDSK